MKNNDDKDALFPLLHDYLLIYLPKQRGVSPHTVLAYRKSLESLLDYVKERKRISLCEVTFEMLTKDMIVSFLDSLETERGFSSSTRNNRRAAICAFMEYAAERDISLASVLLDVKRIPFKKPETVKIVEYMSMKAVSAIVEQPDANTPRGRRDRCFIILMYDTGARIQELVSIRLCDLHISRLSKVRLHGKGGKIRDVPLMEKTVLHLKKYLEEFHSGKSFSSEDPLFYSSVHGAICPISGRRIRYLLQEYGKKAGAVCPEVPESVYPHLFRHSRAMHLYQAGMDLTHISQWLGHSQLETTQIYAYADTEHKRKAIEASTPPDNPLYSKLNPARCTVTDEELLKKLTGLR